MRTYSRTAGTVIASFGVALALLLLATCESALLEEIRETHRAASEITTFTVSYNGNGEHSGSPPVDNTEYREGQTVAVLGNSGALSRGGFIFVGWNTRADGSGDAFNVGDAFAIGSASVVLFARWQWSTNINVGDRGPAGGIIIHDKSVESNGWRYLEATLAEFESPIPQWGGCEPLLPCTLIGNAAQGTAIGTGARNTLAIVDVLGAGEYAASYADALVAGGYEDWFLPSRHEMGAIVDNVVIPDLDVFSGGYYLTSSEISETSAWYYNFGFAMPTPSSTLKRINGYVRAVRAFRSVNPSFIIRYDGNGAEQGDVPIDNFFYEPGEAATVIGNTGGLVREYYLFNGWNTARDGGGTDVVPGGAITMEQKNVTLYAKWTLGGQGPGGGFVFYDQGFFDGWRYLEVAPKSTEWTTAGWGSYGVEVGSAAQHTGIGLGSFNTTAIVLALGAQDSAAKLCTELTHGGRSDWFLPSKDELNEIYRALYLNGIGDLEQGFYWTSSELDADFAWLQFFQAGQQGKAEKYELLRVRAVRRF